MRYILKDAQIDFNTTPVENLFLETFMPSASEIQLKVYLYGYKKAFFKEETSNEEIASILGLQIDDVTRAWEYWNKQGLVNIIRGSEDIYQFKSLRLLYSGIEDYEDDQTSFDFEENMTQDFGKEDENLGEASQEETFNVSKDDLYEMYRAIEDYISIDQPVHISLDPKEIRTLNDLVVDLKLNPFFVSYAYHMASEANDYKSKNPSYVSGVIQKWVKFENIRSIEDLDKYLEKRNEKKAEKKRTRPKKKIKNVDDDKRMTKSERRDFLRKKLEESRNIEF